MKSAQQHQWTIRPATNDDISGVCEMIDAYSLDMHGIHNDARRNVELTWGQPGFSMETDTRIAVSAEGRIIGYGEVEDTSDPHVRISSWMRVHPESREIGVDTALLEWIEERASKAVPKAPAGARVSLSHGVASQDTHLQQLLTDRGYSIVRYFLRMSIELDHEIPKPVWPEGVTIRTFVLEEDLEATVHTFRDSFCDHWGYVEQPFEEELKQWDHWIRSDEEFDPTLTFLVIAEGEIVGLASCDPKFCDDADMGYVAVLGVRRAWRRRGIALALLHRIFREFKKRGQQRVGLGVDATSLTGANRLYEAAGMKSTRQTVAFERELRAGEELSLQSLSEEGASS